MLNFINELKNSTILKSSLGLIFLTLAIKIFGYAEKIIIAYYFGTNYQVDVYTLVLTIVLSIFYFFREIIEPGFLNVFLKSKSASREDEARDIFNSFFRIILLITIAISFISFFYPKIFLYIFAPGLKNEKFILAQQLIRIAIPACIFLALSAVTNITLNALKIFVLPASGDLVFKASIIIILILLFKEYGIAGAAIGILVGSAGRLGLHLTKLFKYLSTRKVNISKENKQKIWQLTWPLLFGVSFSQISNLVDNIFASYLNQGSISALSYSKKLIELPVVIFPYILSVVVFPYFSRLAIEKQNEKLKELLISSLKWIFIFFLPISFLYLIFSQEIVAVAFQRGAFDKYSTILTSGPLFIYSFGLLFFAIETILVIFYYANADTKTPIFVGIGCVVLHICLSWYLIHIIGYLGIAVAYVTQKVIKNSLLLFLLKKKVNLFTNDFFNLILKTCKACILFAIPLIICKLLFYQLNLHGTFRISFFIFVFFAIGALAYIFTLGRMKIISIKSNEGERYK